jgi:hypothetical protein
MAVIAVPVTNIIKSYKPMVDRGGHVKRIKKEQRERIIQLYYDPKKGVDDAMQYARSLGLSERYALRLAEARALHH